jgi:DNA-directed RNA polymerase subunit RPC12/RpoP
VPVLECPNGHRQFAHPDFPLQLLDHLVELDEAGLPASTAKGLLFKQHYCSSCGEKLTDSANEPHTFRVDVTLPQLSPFDVELTLPVHRCQHCGHEQLHSLKEVRSRTPAALAHAFKDAAIAAPA